VDTTGRRDGGDGRAGYGATAMAASVTVEMAAAADLVEAEWLLGFRGGEVRPVGRLYSAGEQVWRGRQPSNTCSDRSGRYRVGDERGIGIGLGRRRIGGQRPVSLTHFLFLFCFSISFCFAFVFIPNDFCKIWD
jgi:hypothetical protein